MTTPLIKDFRRKQLEERIRRKSLLQQEKRELYKCGFSSITERELKLADQCTESNIEKMAKQNPGNFHDVSLGFIRYKRRELRRGR